MKTVKPGDRMRIPAGDWNQVVRMVEQAMAERPVFGRTPGQSPTLCRTLDILVKNLSENDWPAFGVVRLGGPLFDLADNAGEFLWRLALEAFVPGGSGQARGIWGILKEPVAAGQIGRCSVSGVSPVLLHFTPDDPLAATYEYADASDGGRLIAGPSGSARILWAEGTSGDVWGVVEWPLGNRARIEYGQVVHVVFSRTPQAPGSPNAGYVTYHPCDGGGQAVNEAITRSAWLTGTGTRATVDGAEVTCHNPGLYPRIDPGDLVAVLVDEGVLVGDPPERVYDRFVVSPDLYLPGEAKIVSYPAGSAPTRVQAYPRLRSGEYSATAIWLWCSGTNRDANGTLASRPELEADQVVWYLRIDADEGLLLSPETGSKNHALLSATHSDTSPSAPAVGGLVVGTEAGESAVWAQLPPPAEPTGREVLTAETDQSVLWREPRQEHLLDDAAHEDTEDGQPSAGTIIAGNAANHWAIVLPPPVPSGFEYLHITAGGGVEWAKVLQARLIDPLYHSDCDDEDPMVGALVVGVDVDGDPLWGALRPPPVPSDYEYLKYDAQDGLAWRAVIQQALLDDTLHEDTVAYVPVKGSLIVGDMIGPVGQETGKWVGLTPPGQPTGYQYLNISETGLISWQEMSQEALLDANAHADTTTADPTLGGLIVGVGSEQVRWTLLETPAAQQRTGYEYLRCADAGYLEWAKAQQPTLLDPDYHVDTALAAPLFGNLIVGDANTKWNALAFATAANDGYDFLRADPVQGPVWSRMSQPNLLDSDAHGDTVTGLAAKGSLIYGTVDATWARLLADTPPQGEIYVLTCDDADTVSWGRAVHALLGAWHEDTDPHAPVAGDLVVAVAQQVGNPLWSALAVGNDGDVLTVANGVPAWVPGVPAGNSDGDTLYWDDQAGEWAILDGSGADAGDVLTWTAGLPGWAPPPVTADDLDAIGWEICVRKRLILPCQTTLPLSAVVSGADFRKRMIAFSAYATPGQANKPGSVGWTAPLKGVLVQNQTIFLVPENLDPNAATVWSGGGWSGELLSFWFDSDDGSLNATYHNPTAQWMHVDLILFASKIMPAFEDLPNE